MLKKSATTKLQAEALHIPEGKGWELVKRDNIKVASIDKTRPVDLGGFDLQAAIKENPDHLFVKVFAIKADEVNDNGDYFSREELAKAAETFIGVPVFVNHQNDDIEKARGKVAHAWFDQDMNGIYCVNMVDRKAYPKLARGIEEGYITGTSMGAQVGHSLCSICHNKAASADEFCEHIANRKNKKFSGKHECKYHESSCSPKNDCPKCGCKHGESNKLAHKDTQVFEYNYDIKFIEDSFVVNPACHDCLVCDVLNLDLLGLRVAEVAEKVRKVASDSENLSMQKIAGEREINELNEAMNLLEGVVRSMMAQKQSVSMEYVSDLVDTIAQVQETADELIEMGYPQLPSPSVPEAQAGTTDPASPVDGGAQQMDPSQMQAPPVMPQSSPGSTSGDMGGIGTVTKPSFSSNNEKSREDFVRVAEKMMNDIKQVCSHSQWLDKEIQIRRDAVHNTRRLAEASSEGYRVVISSDDHGEVYVSEIKEDQVPSRSSVLSVVSTDGISKEMQKLISENPNKAAELVLNHRLSKESDNTMKDSHKKEAAGAGVQPDQVEMITEKQLSNSDTPEYTARWEGDFYEGITQSDEQLGKESDVYNDTDTTSPQTRQGTYEFITEAQLAAVTDGCVCRWKDFPEVITEKQWTDFSRAVGAVLPSDWLETISQKQLISLREDHRWEDPGFITEVQLANQNNALPEDDHSSRWKAASALDYRKNLLKSATEAVADSIASYGLSPADIVNATNTILASPQSQMKAAYLTLINAVPTKIAERKDLVSRSRYHGKNISEKPIDLVLAALGDNVQYYKATDLVNALRFVVNDETAFKKAEAAGREKLASFDNDVTVSVSDDNLFRQAFKDLNGSDDGVYQVLASIKGDLGLDSSDADNFVQAASDFARKEAGSDDLVVTSIDVDGQGAFQVILKEQSVLTAEEKDALAKIADRGFGEKLEDADEMLNQDQEDEEAYETKDKYASRRARREQILKQAQMMGGQMGGQGGASQAPGAGATLPQAPGDMGAPVESFDGGGEDDFDFDMEGEDGDMMPKPPGSICPVCGSEDVNIVEGKGKCNNCGSEFNYKVTLEVTKWSGLNDEEGADDEDAVGEGFALEDEAPMGDEALPVAASTIIRPGALKKIAESEISFGSVSPYTGSTNTEKVAENHYFCRDTGRQYSVHLAMNKDKVPFAEWRFHAVPMKLADSCPSCRRAKSAFVKGLEDLGITEAEFDAMPVKQRGDVILKMQSNGSFSHLKTASKQGTVLGDFKKAFNYAGDKFPVESCREKLARRFGENALALSGPCEGKSLVDCVCNQMKSANIYNEGLAIKLAQVYTERDPSHECVEDFIRDGYKIEDAVFACSKIKAKYAQAIEMLADELSDDFGDDFGGDDDGFEDVGVIDVIDEAPSPFDSEDPFEGGEGSITVELPLDIIDQFEQAIDVARGEDPAEEEHHQDVPEGDALVEIPGEAADAVEDAAEDALETVDAIEDAANEVGDDFGPEEGEGVEDVGEEMIEDDSEDGEEVESMDMSMPPVMADDEENDENEENDRGETCPPCEELHKEGDPVESYANTEESLMKEAQAFKPHKISGHGKINLDVSSVMDALGMTKEAADSSISISPAQDDKDLGKVHDGGKATIGHEDNADLSGPDVFSGNAEMGNEKNTDGLDSNEDLPTVPHGGAEMGHEKEQGYDAEKQTTQTGGEDGAGNNRSASSTKAVQNDLAERLIATSGKLEEAKPVADDEDIQPISDNKDHSNTPEDLKKTPHEDSDEVEVPEQGNASHMGHEDDQGDVPKSPEHHPEFPEGGGRDSTKDKNERYAPEKQTRDKGTVIAEGDEKTKVRKEAAFGLAGRMVKADLLEADQLLNKVEELMQYDVTQIQDLEKSMFAYASKGLNAAPRGIQQPLIIPETSNQKTASGELSTKLQGLFKLDQQNRLAEGMEENDGSLHELRKLHGRG